MAGAMTGGVAGIVAGGGDLASEPAQGSLDFTCSAHGQALDASGDGACGAFGNARHVGRCSDKRCFAHRIKNPWPGFEEAGANG